MGWIAEEESRIRRKAEGLLSKTEVPFVGQRTGILRTRIGHTDEPGETAPKLSAGPKRQIRVIRVRHSCLFSSDPDQRHCCRTGEAVSQHLVCFELARPSVRAQCCSGHVLDDGVQGRALSVLFWATSPGTVRIRTPSTTQI